MLRFPRIRLVPALTASTFDLLRISSNALQVNRIIKYIKIDLNEKENAKMPQILRDVAKEESRRVREKAKDHIRSIRSSKRGKPGAKNAADAKPPSGFSDQDNPDGYLTLAMEDDDDWPGDVVVDDGAPISEAEIDAALDHVQKGEALCGRELRAVLGRVRVEFLQKFKAEHAEIIERTRLHAQTKTKQMLVQKMAEMRKQNHRKTQMLTALDDTLGPDDTWAVTPTKPPPLTIDTPPPDATEAPPLSPADGAPSPPPDFSEPQPSSTTNGADSDSEAYKSESTIVPQGATPVKAAPLHGGLSRSNEPDNLPPPQQFDDEDEVMPPPPQEASFVPPPPVVPAHIEPVEEDEMSLGMPEPSPMVIESPIPGGGPKFFPSSPNNLDTDVKRVVVDGQEVQIRPRRRDSTEENGGRRYDPAPNALSALYANATFPLQKKL